jgi:integrase/recombinase XerD
MSITRTSAPLKAKQLAKQLRKERPDYFYLKEIFKYLRKELDVKVQKEAKRLPYVPTEKEIKRYYQEVWNSKNIQNMVIIKVLLYTGIRVGELVKVKIEDVDLDSGTIKVMNGKGNKDRVVPFPQTFKEVLAMHISAAEKKEWKYLWDKVYGFDEAKWIKENDEKYDGLYGVTYFPFQR